MISENKMENLDKKIVQIRPEIRRNYSKYDFVLSYNIK